MFAATQRTGDNGIPWFSFSKADRRVTCFYFYLWDADFGPAFIKICAYFPYPIKVWLNGHEWAKRQADQGRDRVHRAVQRVRHLCGSRRAAGHLRPAGPGHHRGVLRTLDEPAAGAADRARPRRGLLVGAVDAPGRGLAHPGLRRPAPGPRFFDALVADNLDIGRPDQVELVFTGKHERRGRPRTQPLTFKTKVVTRGVQVTVNAFYKNSRIKQYLKDGRALRIETVINSPDDLRCHRRLVHLDELQARARAVNRRLLDTERVGQGCVLASPAFERIARPTLTEDGRRAPALRFGDPRVQALAGALCTTCSPSPASPTRACAP